MKVPMRIEVLAEWIKSGLYKYMTDTGVSTINLDNNKSYKFSLTIVGKPDGMLIANPELEEIKHD